MHCLQCHSTHVVKNGGTHDGKQRFRCQDRSGQFVENPTRQLIADETRELINRLLKQRLAIAAIARVTRVSEPWLQM